MAARVSFSLAALLLSLLASGIDAGRSGHVQGRRRLKAGTDVTTASKHQLQRQTQTLGLRQRHGQSGVHSKAPRLGRIQAWRNRAPIKSFIATMGHGRKKAASAPGLPPRQSLPPNVVGSGTRLHFHADADRAYCLVTDPCIHVNAFMAAETGNPSRTYVKAYGFRVQHHTLAFTALAPFLADETPLVSFALDGKTAGYSLSLGEIVEAQDGSLQVEKWGTEEGAYLLTAPQCRVRILIYAKRGWKTEYPRLSLDVLDWASLDAPHGLLGQMFPNHADVSKLMVQGRMGTGRTQSTLGMVPTESWSMSVGTAFKALYQVQMGVPLIEGSPLEYAASGVLEPDCMYSRFGSPVPSLSGSTSPEGALGQTRLRGMTSEQTHSLY